MLAFCWKIRIGPRSQTRSPSSPLFLFFWEDSPTKIDYRTIAPRNSPPFFGREGSPSTKPKNQKRVPAYSNLSNLDLAKRRLDRTADGSKAASATGSRPLPARRSCDLVFAEAVKQLMEWGGGEGAFWASLYEILKGLRKGQTRCGFRHIQ